MIQAPTQLPPASDIPDAPTSVQESPDTEYGVQDVLDPQYSIQDAIDARRGVRYYRATALTFITISLF